jgi:hypothetical protein
MAFAPTPSAEEIVRLYEAGELAAELARYHEGPDEAEDTFLERCIELHNGKKIDLVVVPCQPGFKNIPKHDFFTAQHLYCEAIPKLDTDVTALMECCRTLVEQAGADGAAGQPNDAFRLWCKNNPTEGALVISKAREGGDLAKQFVTFALQAAGNVEIAVDFVRSYDDERRLFGMAALGRMAIADSSKAQEVTRVLEPYLSAGDDDNLRANALFAAFDVLKKHNDVETASSFVEAAAKQPGPATLHSLAHVIWLHHKLLTQQAIQTALDALQAVQSDHQGTLRIIDIGLQQLLGADSGRMALNFLTTILRDEKITLDSFRTTASELKRNNQQRLYEIIVSWFLSGSTALCDNVTHLIPFDEKRPFDANIASFELTPAQQIFLCRKAIGFLFTRPVICCSILVSVLRGGDKDAADEVTDLLFEPMLVNYSGKTIDYLKEIATGDPAYAAVNKALERHQAYFSGLESTGSIKELHPSDYERDVVRQRTYDEMRAAQKAAEHQSVLLSVVHRSTLLYGKRSLTYVLDSDGSRRAVAMDLQSVGVSFEMPRHDVLDPAGLDFLLRVFRAEKLK